MTTGKRLRAWRDAAGLSQEEAARKIGTGQRTWGQWELEQATPEVDYAAAIERMTDGAVTVLDWARLRGRQRRKARRTPKTAPTAPESGTDVTAEAARAS